MFYLFNDPFSFFNQLNSIYKDYDWEELKKTGKVEETTEENNEVVTITKNYKSFDGKHIISTSNSYYKANENAIKIEELTEQLDIAVDKQDYEIAAKLRDQINELKK